MKGTHEKGHAEGILDENEEELEETCGVGGEADHEVHDHASTESAFSVHICSPNDNGRDQTKRDDVEQHSRQQPRLGPVELLVTRHTKVTYEKNEPARSRRNSPRTSTRLYSALRNERWPRSHKHIPQGGEGDEGAEEKETADAVLEAGDGQADLEVQSSREDADDAGDGQMRDEQRLVTECQLRPGRWLTV